MQRPIALVAGALLLGGCSLFGQFNQMSEADIQFRNDGVRHNVAVVATALAMYARGHKGLYPPKATWVGELQRNYNLGDNRLPPNPWSLMNEHTQANVPPLGPIPAMTDASFDGAAIGTVLGKGSRPDSPIYATTTYGALLYDVTPNRHACALYGVGQKGEDALVVETHFRGRP